MNNIHTALFHKKNKKNIYNRNNIAYLEYNMLKCELNLMFSDT